MTQPPAADGARATARGPVDRASYDPAFLGVDLPMPGLADDVPTVLLPYLHYSVLFRPDRRLAAVTALTAGTAPPLGPYRTFQVPIADIAALSGVALDRLVLVDLMPPGLTGAAPPPPGQASTAWVELRSLEDVVLTS